MLDLLFGLGEVLLGPQPDPHESGGKVAADLLDIIEGLDVGLGGLGDHPVGLDLVVSLADPANALADLQGKIVDRLLHRGDRLRVLELRLTQAGHRPAVPDRIVKQQIEAVAQEAIVGVNGDAARVLTVQMVPGKTRPLLYLADGDRGTRKDGLVGLDGLVRPPQAPTEPLRLDGGGEVQNRQRFVLRHGDVYLCRGDPQAGLLQQGIVAHGRHELLARTDLEFPLERRRDGDDLAHGRALELSVGNEVDQAILDLADPLAGVDQIGVA